MNSSINKKATGELDLETDLPVNPADNRADSSLVKSEKMTIDEYIDFLEEIGAFNHPKPAPVIFRETFSLFP